MEQYTNRSDFPLKMSYEESRIPIRSDSSVSISKLDSTSHPINTSSKKRASMMAYTPCTSRLPIPVISSQTSNSNLTSQSTPVKVSTNIYSSKRFSLLNNNEPSNKNIPLSPGYSNLSKISDLSLYSKIPKSHSLKSVSSEIPLSKKSNRSILSNQNIKPLNDSKLKFNYYTSTKLTSQTRKDRYKSESISNIQNLKQNQRLSRSSLSLSYTNRYKRHKVKDIIHLFEILCTNSNTKVKFNSCLDNNNLEINDLIEIEKSNCYAFENLSSKRPDLFEKLTMYERIMQYSAIYFTGLDKDRKIKPDLQNSKNNFGFDDKHGNYYTLIGDHIKYRYEIKSNLGKGAFGSVVSVIDHSIKNKNLFACKIIKNDPRWSLQAVEEIKILKKMNHNNILKYVEHFTFRSHMCIITELLGVTLYESIQANNYKGFSLELVKRFTKDILNGVLYLNSHNIIHCDLKPENIMISNDGILKIIDFGSSCSINNLKYSYLQSRFYRSPEVLLGGRYDTKMDIWSIGLISIELFAGEPLFQPQNEWELFMKCIEYLNIPSRQCILKLRNEIKTYGFVGSNSNNNEYNTLLWKAFDNNGGINLDYVNKKSQRYDGNNKRGGFNPGHGSIKTFLRKHIDYELVETCESESEMNKFYGFINMCLVWNKWGRADARECLKSDFFN